jgi:membrane associated rhomboid family serine protease
MLPLRDRLPTRRFPVVNCVLLAVNVLVFMWERAIIGLGYAPQRLLYDFGLVPRFFMHDPVGSASSVLSSMFMHDPTGWAHVGGNMLYLWIFGDNVEDAMGRGRYALFYLLSGIAAAGAQICIDPASNIPVVGASGAIAGVLAAYGSLYPRSPITVLNPVPILWLFFGLSFEIPAWFVIGLFFVANAVSGYASVGSHDGGVAFFAHLGGFVAGLFLVRMLMMAHTKRSYDPWNGFRSSRNQAAPRRRPWDA